MVEAPTPRPPKNLKKKRYDSVGDVELQSRNGIKDTNPY